MTKIGRPWFFGDKGIRAGFDDAAIDFFGAQHPAKARRRFVQRVFKFDAGSALLFQLKRSGEPGDSSADDGDAFHLRRLSPSDLRFVDPAAECSCTNFARFLTFSTGVSGRMPWPRLKIWPDRPPARSRMSSARDFSSFQSAKRSTGSRFPCTAAL